MKKMYKYQVMHVSAAGQQSIECFVRLKDAKAFIEPFTNSKYYIVPCHGPNYYIEYFGRVFTKHISPAY